VVAKAEAHNLCVSAKHVDITEAARVNGIPRQRISEALAVLRYAPGMADDVLAKKLRLDQAVIEAKSNNLLNVKATVGRQQHSP
jgi:hypothetical protein